jgi:hypothetical protein
MSGEDTRLGEASNNVARVFDAGSLNTITGQVIFVTPCFITPQSRQPSVSLVPPRGFNWHLQKWACGGQLFVRFIRAEAANRALMPLIAGSAWTSQTETQQGHQHLVGSCR